MGARSKRVTQQYINFTGGLQTFVSPLLLKSDESPYFYNCDITQSGRLKKAKGYKLFSGATGEPERPGLSKNGIFCWNKEDSTSKLYTTNREGTLEEYDSSGIASSWTFSVTSGDGISEFDTCFVNTGSGVGTGADDYVDYMFIAQGLNNNTVYYFDGSELSQMSGLYAEHLAEYKGSMYFGNVKQNGKVYPSRLVYTSVASLDIPSINYIDDMGEAITALKEYSGSLFIFSVNKVAYWDGYSLTFLPCRGGVLNSSVVQVTDEVLLWYNRGGVYMYAGGTQPVLVSRPVKEVLDAVRDADSVTAGIDSEMRYCLHVGDVSFNGDDLKDVVLRYDPLMNSWSILTDRKPRYWTLNHAGGVYESYGIDGTENGETAVYQADIGYSLIGDSQKSLYQSPKIFGTEISNVHDLKNGYKLQVAYKPTGNDEYLTVSFRVDGTGEWKHVDEKQDNISLNGTEEIKVVELRLPKGTVGKFLEVKLEHESELGGFEVYAVNVIYDMNENAYN